ncbi:MAG: hypothetical protein JRD89_01630 [Deltaproteobacteria bacterium]|nr:hypothetical protein [Deltaproteobacteria bacterium]
MSLFNGMGSASATGSGVYFNSNHNYLCKVLCLKIIQSRSNDNMFVAEMEVIESDDPERGPGSCPAWVVNFKHDSALGNIKGLLGALNGVNPNEVEALNALFSEVNEKGETVDISVDISEYAVSEANPLAGNTVRLRTEGIKTRAGGDFTKHLWRPTDEA